MVHFPADSTPLLVFAALLFISRILYGCTTEIHSSNVSCIEIELKALFQFKQSLVDKSNRLSSWTGKDCCAWRGVGCSKNTGHVVKLDLRNSDQNYYSYRNPCNTCLAGQLNPSLINLKYLRYLDLSWNNFSTIQIPTFLGSFKDLRYLNLSGARFYGEIPPNLANLSNLQYLDFGDEFSFLMTNNLYWVANLSSLESLSLLRVDLSDVDNWLEILNMLPSLITLESRGCGLSNTPHLNSLVNFTSLTSIDLSSNYFNSNIPNWLFNLTDLVHLDLSYSNLYGLIPDTFGKLMSSLIYLDLSGNSFHTSLPKSLCNLSNLVHLDLSHCGFQGSIPREIECLEKLSKFNLAYNELNGSIPSSLWKLTKLQMLAISGNSLTGVLSEKNFEELIELKELAISGYSLTLNFSSSWIPPFQLQHIFMDSVKVGPQFPAWLKTQREVEMLSMSSASLSGAIPHWFWFWMLSSDFVYLDLSDNILTGKPPLEFKHANNTYKRTICLNSNKFEGSPKSFPSDTGLLDLSRNLLTGNIPLPNGDTTIISIAALQLSNNRFTGSIPKDLCKMEILIALDISNNQLSGRIPLCLGNLRYLKRLNLANNSLCGHIPSSLGNLELLQNLQLSGNKFVGKLPSLLQNLTSLEFLDLGENGLQDDLPTWIGEKLLNLRILRFQSNNFHGNISYTLCQLSQLHVLNLANNNLTGQIPKCFNELSMMLTEVLEFFSASVSISDITLWNFMKGRELQYNLNDGIFLKSISLSENNLVGEIPEEITDLVGLRNLDLSNNHLSGRMPETIGNLKLLESLDLSVNELSGAIPPSLSAIFSLAYLNLSHNKLSGPIPSGNQLQTLDDPSIYQGNDGLCGKPLPNDCPEDKSPSGNGILLEEHNFPWFYSGIGPGFAVGFLGVLGILHFNKSWRYAYFKMVENGCDRIWVMIVLYTSLLQRN